MKYLVIGAGGTGGAIGAYLARKGKDVTFIARGKHLAAMKAEGLKMYSKRVGDFKIAPVKACEMSDYKEVPDVIFVCVKYYALEETIAFIGKVSREQTVVIPILNVFSAGELIGKACPHTTVLDGCIYILSMIEAPGVISQPAPIFKMYYGFRKGQDQGLISRVEKVTEDLREAEIEAYFTADIKKEAIKKFSFVSPMGAAGLYYGGKAGDFMQPGEKRDFFIKLVGEVEALGKAMGITFEEDLVAVNAQILDGLNREATTSMQRDVASGGNSELEGLVHQVVKLAAQYRVAVPTYEMVSNWAKQLNIK